jgi:flavin reductase (DIM6/NTAB) family NADH-FMN oxidoreductase RutF
MEAALTLLPPFPVVLVTVPGNVLTINQLHYFTFDPLRLGIAVARSRHSFGLLRQHGEFVVNVPSAEMVEAVRICGAVSGRDGDKFAAAGQACRASTRVAAPTICRCPAQLECRVEREIEFEDRVWFIGAVLACRRQESFAGERALLCGRREYRTVGAVVAKRSEY